MSVSSVCLVVLDGWGLAEDGPGNAVALARTPVMDALCADYPQARLTAMGPAVGLPDEQMGNSEAGHLNLGAGAIVAQDLALIDNAIRDGHWRGSETLRDLVDGAPRLHLVGLASSGGVHSHDRHLEALIASAAQLGIPDVVVHAFTDGRDTRPTDGRASLDRLQRWCEAAGTARVGSVIGRYFAMDRDHRWDRTKRAYDLIVHGVGDHHAPSGEAAVRTAYERGETDEFIAPTTVGQEARVRAGDAMLSFNFRPDRIRQLAQALADPTFAGFDRGSGPVVERFATMTRYEQDSAHPALFPPHRPDVTLAGVVSAHGMRQLHVAETEKYAHVTYFFNGGREAPYPGETRRLVPSPRDVPTYDHNPAMAAREATAAFVADWQTQQFRFAVFNFANADMVGHTGRLDAAIEAVEVVDECLARVVEAVHGSGGTCVITADHGNAEQMLEPDGSPNTAHTVNPVPLVVTVNNARLREDGILADVAPTVLQLLAIDPPPEMTGRSLLELSARSERR